MKKYQFSKNKRNQQHLNGIFGGVIIAIFLSSCCFKIISLDDVSKRKCNCNDDNIQLAKVSDGKDIPIKGPNAAIHHEDANRENNLKQIHSMQSIPLNTIKYDSKLKDDTKKLPLGIKAITTEVFAGSNMGSPALKTDGPNKKAGFGFNLGLSSNYYFNRNFSINPMLRFRQNNFSTSDGDGSSEIKTNYKYNQISMPVLANFRLSPKVSLGIGPEINYLLSATSRITGSYYGEEEKENITDRSTRLGIGLETNLKVRLSERMGINLGVIKGFTDADKNHSSDYGSYEGTLGDWFMFQLNIWVNLCNFIGGERAL